MADRCLILTGLTTPGTCVMLIMKFHWQEWMEKSNSHHQQFVGALRRRWRRLGGPVSLTGWLRACRPLIQTRLKNGVRWAWLAPRIIGVFTQAGDELAEDLPPVSSKMLKTMRELYRRGAKPQCIGRPDGHRPAMTIQRSPAPMAELSAQLASLPPRPPSDHGGKRGRMRQSLNVAKSLGNFE